MRVILIYEEIPENTRIYDLELDSDDYEKICACNGRYINDDEMTPEMEWLSEFLTSCKPVRNRDSK